MLAPSAVDRFAADMWDLKTVGIELRELNHGGVEADVYFSDPILRDVQELASGARVLRGADLLASDDLEPRDWMETYRSQARPFVLGSGFLVDPGEPELEEWLGASVSPVLHIPARSAFGTGTHQSTRLVVQILESLELTEMRILDVGTGTGILAIVALRLGADSVVALDLDPVAAIAACENSRLNGTFIGLFAGRVGAIEVGTRFDLALVNILPSHIESDLGDLVGLLGASGQAVFSGILVEEEKTVRRTLEAAGFGVLTRHVEDEWCALHVRVSRQ